MCLVVVILGGVVKQYSPICSDDIESPLYTINLSWLKKEKKHQRHKYMQSVIRLEKSFYMSLQESETVHKSFDLPQII